MEKGRGVVKMENEGCERKNDSRESECVGMYGEVEKEEMNQHERMF